MLGMGTIINSAAIIAGGIVGLICGSRLKVKYQETMTMACGICSTFIGLSGTLAKMFRIGEGGIIETNGTMMAIVCMVLGGLVGEFIDFDRRFEDFGEWLKRKTASEGDNRFVDAFVTASLTVCIGAMAIVGSIQDGLTGDYTMLAAKSVLDLIIVMALAASMGKGAIFSAIPVFVLQGSVTLLSRFIEPIMTPAALNNLSLTGSMLIFCVGVNLIWGRMIKVANLLPTIVFAVIAALLGF